MAIEISWIGRTCFRLKGREGTVITDPCPPASGFNIGKIDAGIVTMSRREDPMYGTREAVPGTARVLDAPGEYEIGGMLVTGLAIPRPEKERTVAFIVELDGIRVAHLGVPGPSVDKAVIGPLEGVDILLLPVGGHGSLGAATAADLMTAIEAKITIPMHFKTESEPLDLDPLDRFLKDAGTRPEAQAKLSVSRAQLPAESTIVVLEPR